MKKLLYLLIMAGLMVSALSGCLNLTTTASDYFQFQIDNGQGTFKDKYQYKFHFEEKEGVDGVWLVPGKGKDKGYYVIAPPLAQSSNTLEAPSPPDDGRIFVRFDQMEPDLRMRH